MTNTAVRTTQMPAESVAKLLAAKGLDAWTKTIAKGIRSAQRDGQSYFIGTTALAYFIDARPVPGTRFEATATGQVFKVEA